MAHKNMKLKQVPTSYLLAHKNTKTNTFTDKQKKIKTK